MPPLGPYDTWEECIEDNQDKDDPEAYCATLERDANTCQRCAMPAVAHVTWVDGRGVIERDGDDTSHTLCLLHAAVEVTKRATT